MASRANALRAWSAAVVDGGDDSLAGVASRLLERTVHDTASIAAALRAGATAVAARRLRMADDEVGATSVLLWFSTSEHCVRRQQHVQQILALAPNLQQELMTTIQEQMAAERRRRGGVRPRHCCVQQRGRSTTGACRPTRRSPRARPSRLARSAPFR